MGLFDEIKCKVPLPAKRGVKTAAEWKNHTFQTKDLDVVMLNFEIRKTGLWREEVTYGPSEKKSKWDAGLKVLKRKWVKHDSFTGYVNFYDFIQDVGDSNDLWVEFRAHFKKGKFQGKVELFEWRLENNNERKEEAKKRENEWKIRDEFCGKWYFKYGLRYWNNLVRFVFGQIISVNQWLGSKLWKAERWLSF